MAVYSGDKPLSSSREHVELARNGRSQLGALLGVRKGPQTVIPVVAGQDIALMTSWTISNIGSTSGVVGIRSTLKADGPLGDATQLVVDENMVASGDLAPDTILSGNQGPTTIPASDNRTLFRELLIPSIPLEKEQGFGFNWWVLITEAFDMATGQPLESFGSSGFNPSEIRDWFRLEVPTVSDLRVADEAFYIVQTR